MADSQSLISAGCEPVGWREENPSLLPLALLCYKTALSLGLSSALGFVS